VRGDRGPASQRPHPINAREGYRRACTWPRTRASTTASGACMKSRRDARTADLGLFALAAGVQASSQARRYPRWTPIGTAPRGPRPWFSLMAAGPEPVRALAVLSRRNAPRVRWPGRDGSEMLMPRMGHCKLAIVAAGHAAVLSLHARSSSRNITAGIKGCEYSRG
jgi:hypothetical protein